MKTRFSVRQVGLAVIASGTVAIGVASGCSAAPPQRASRCERGGYFRRRERIPIRSAGASRGYVWQQSRNWRLWRRPHQPTAGAHRGALRWLRLHGLEHPTNLREHEWVRQYRVPHQGSQRNRPRGRWLWVRQLHEYRGKHPRHHADHNVHSRPTGLGDGAHSSQRERIGDRLRNTCPSMARHSVYSGSNCTGPNLAGTRSRRGLEFAAHQVLRVWSGRVKVVVG